MKNNRQNGILIKNMALSEVTIASIRRELRAPPSKYRSGAYLITKGGFCPPVEDGVTAGRPRGPGLVREYREDDANEEFMAEFETVKGVS